jgi:integrase
MGRKRQGNHDLPPRLHIKSGRYYYVTFVDRKRNWLALGADRVEALRRWAELEGSELDANIKRFDVIAARFQRDEFPRLAPRTQHDYERAIRNLTAVFGAMPIDAIKPVHVVEYLRKRGDASKVQANREIATLSTIFNRAREWGFANGTNPCEGVRRHREEPRDRYVTDEEYLAVWQCADEATQDAMDIALLTGQREGDVLKMQESDIRDGLLHIRQNKTRHLLRIPIVGELKEVSDRILARPTRKASNLIQDDKGMSVTGDALRKRFRKAKDAAGMEFQFRDLRAKAASDVESLERAQKLLGHKTRTMTEDYVRPRRGEVVMPLKRDCRNPGEL